MATSARQRSDNVLSMPLPGGAASAAINGPSGFRHDAIAARAYELYCERGCGHGHDLDDWLQAERDLRGGGSISPAP